MARNRIALISLAMFAAVGCTTGGGPVEVVAPQGVTPVVVDGNALVVVRDGDEVKTFIAGDRRGERLQYCEAEQVFVTLENGSAFGLDGIKLDGPSPSNLDQVSSSVVSPELVEIDVRQVIEGEPLPGATDLPEPFRPQVDETWVSWFMERPTYCPDL